MTRSSVEWRRSAPEPAARTPQLVQKGVINDAGRDSRLVAEAQRHRALTGPTGRCSAFRTVQVGEIDGVVRADVAVTHGADAGVVATDLDALIADDDEPAVAAITIAELGVGVEIATGKRRQARRAFLDDLRRRSCRRDVSACPRARPRASAPT